MEFPVFNNIPYPHTEGEHSYYSSMMEDNSVLYEIAIDSVKLESNNHEIFNFHKCKLCPYKTNSFHLMRSHLRRHRVTKLSKVFNCMTANVEVYKCSKCDYRTMLLINLNKHIDVTHRYPSVKNKSILNYEYTLLNGAKAKTYDCENCSFTTHSQLLYVSHYRNCPEKVIAIEEDQSSDDVYIEGNNELLFQCFWCPYMAKRRTTLDGHMRVKHPFQQLSKSGNVFECGLCFFRTNVAFCLKRHVEAAHPRQQKKFEANETSPKRKKLFQRKKSFNCWKCNFKSSYMAGFVNHLYHKHVSDGDIKWLQCDQCPYRSIFSAHFKNHILKHKNKLKCTMCEFSTRTAKGLKQHILEEHMSNSNDLTPVTESSKVKMNKCNLCDFKFMIHEEYTSHIIEKHVSNELVQCFKCELCGYKTINEPELKEHVMDKHVDPLHTDWVHCEMCTSTFRTNLDLKQHIFDKHIL